MHLPSPVDRILKPATTIILIIISIFQKEKNLNHLEIIKSVLSRMETIVLSFINTNNPFSLVMNFQFSAKISHRRRRKIHQISLLKLFIFIFIKLTLNS